ncbi:MAG TPA: CAP domain-containing protein [Gaiellaceae bacterium]|nr:CAP domain-containing protein [Gaiellaceae bacterium]
MATLVLAASLLAGAAPAPAATVTEEPSLEARLVERVNAVRTSRGLRALRIEYGLSRAAERHARSMAAAAYFRHELFTPQRDPRWTAYGRWIRWYYPGPGWSSWSAGENLAWGAPDISARQTVRRWLGSPGHRANLLARGWRHVGVAAVHIAEPAGYYGAWDDVTVVVAEFGRRS